ncbi:hypothetical protein ACIQXD_01215 [Streptomyces uncialis]|uniref:hypothetical protein n=1 Tax=Streptomyces uncialis TaxID=1048205 RepID=UPI003802AA76
MEQRRAAAGLKYPGMLPVVETIAAHTGVILDDATLGGELLTVSRIHGSQTRGAEDTNMF